MLVRTKDRRGKYGDDSTIGFLMELADGAGSALNEDALLMSYKSGFRWRVWTREQATPYLPKGS